MGLMRSRGKAACGLQCRLTTPQLQHSIVGTIRGIGPENRGSRPETATQKILSGNSGEGDGQKGEKRRKREKSFGEKTSVVSYNGSQFDSEFNPP